MALGNIIMVKVLIMKVIGFEIENKEKEHSSLYKVSIMANGGLI